MKKLALIFAITVFSSFISFGKMQIFFQNSFFNIPGQGPYVETYLTTVGKSVSFAKNANNKFQASVLVTILFKQEGQIKAFKKYSLFSPEINDTLGVFPNFVDQQRIQIPSGIYNFELTVEDNNKPAESYTYRDIITVDFPANEISFSGIQLLEKYEASKTQSILTKNGFDLYPYVADFYPDNFNKLIFYAEIYNSPAVLKDEEYLIKYSIVSSSKNTPVADFSRFKKVKPQEVYVLLAEFDIEKLPSGNYFLSVEAVSKENKILGSKKIFFQRSKTQKSDEIDYVSEDINNTFAASITNKDTLKEYINCLRPICNEAEKRFISNLMRADTIAYMQQFFYSFWQTRNFSNPQGEWNKYKEQVIFVSRLYKTSIEKGYETDRGRVYLQYGSPNSITENKFEPDQLTNEIWFYNSLKSQNLVKFVFINRDRTTHAYYLLHSDLYGEIHTQNWESIIYKIPNEDNTNMRGNEFFSGDRKQKQK